MASTFSPSLRLELIGDGDQSGIWGQTTNNNLGALVEQAIAGVITVNIGDANYALTNFNGVTDEARNAVITITGSISQQRNIVVPLADKIYTFRNATTGGFPIQIIAPSGTGTVIPNGVTASVYCDGANVLPLTTGALDNYSVNGNLNVTGTTTLTGALGGSTAVFSGAVSSVSPTFTGTPTAPTAAPGTNTTQIATTAYTTAAVTAATGALGTMSTQNASAVAITGGTITGITDLAVADGGTGRSTLAANAVLVGDGTSGVNSVAPGTSGNLLTSNGTAWTSAAPVVIGVGQTWQDVTASRASGTPYTNSTSTPIQISIVLNSTGTNQGTLVINGVTAVSGIVGATGATHQYSFIIPVGNTYELTLTGGSVNRWLELR